MIEHRQTTKCVNVILPNNIRPCCGNHGELAKVMAVNVSATYLLQSGIEMD